MAQHHLLVVRWAWLASGDRDDADDIAQQVWIKVHGGLPSYRGRSSFTSWLYQVVANAASGFRRTRDRRLAILAAEPVNDSANPLIEEEIDQGRLGAVVMARLQQLPPRQREVFALADLEERTMAEIAEMLKIPESTVRTNLFKARRAMRAGLLGNHRRFIEEYRS